MENSISYKNYKELIDEATSHLDISDGYKETRDIQLEERSELFIEKVYQNTIAALEKISED